MMRRSGSLRRYTPLRSYTALVRRAWKRKPKATPKAKRRYTGPSRAVIDLVLARSQGLCEYPGCESEATDRHHRLNRKSGGRGEARGAEINQAAWILHACRHHHRWVTEHPFEAYHMGWLLHETEDAAEVPVQYHDDVVYLDNEGFRRPV